MTQLSEAYVDFIADILINGLEARHGTTRA
jgi:hypothetical protein